MSTYYPQQQQPIGGVYQGGTAPPPQAVVYQQHQPTATGDAQPLAQQQLQQLLQQLQAQQQQQQQPQPQHGGNQAPNAQGTPRLVVSGPPPQQQPLQLQGLTPELQQLVQHLTQQQQPPPPPPPQVIHVQAPPPVQQGYPPPPLPHVYGPPLPPQQAPPLGPPGGPQFQQQPYPHHPGQQHGNHPSAPAYPPSKHPSHTKSGKGGGGNNSARNNKQPGAGAPPPPSDPMVPNSVPSAFPVATGPGQPPPTAQSSLFGHLEKVLLEKDAECATLRRELAEKSKQIAALQTQLAQVNERYTKLLKSTPPVNRGTLVFPSYNRGGGTSGAQLSGNNSFLGSTDSTSPPIAFTTSIDSVDGPLVSTAQKKPTKDDPAFGPYVTRQIQSKRGNLAAQAMTQAGSAVISLAVTLKDQQLALANIETIWSELAPAVGGDRERRKLSKILQSPGDFGAKTVYSILSSMPEAMAKLATARLIESCSSDIILTLLLHEATSENFGPLLLKEERNPSHYMALHRVLAAQVNWISTSAQGQALLHNALTGANGAAVQTEMQKILLPSVTFWNTFSPAVGGGTPTPRSPTATGSHSLSSIASPTSGLPAALSCDAAAPPPPVVKKSSSSAAPIFVLSPAGVVVPLQVPVGTQHGNRSAKYLIKTAMSHGNRIHALRAIVKRFNAVQLKMQEDAETESQQSSPALTGGISNSNSMEEVCKKFAFELSEFIRHFPRETWASVACTEFAAPQFSNVTVLQQLCVHCAETADFIKAVFVKPLVDHLNGDEGNFTGRDANTLLDSTPTIAVSQSVGDAPNPAAPLHHDPSLQLLFGLDRPDSIVDEAHSFSKSYQADLNAENDETFSLPSSRSGLYQESSSFNMTSDATNFLGTEEVSTQSATAVVGPTTTTTADVMVQPEAEVLDVGTPTTTYENPPEAFWLAKQKEPLYLAYCQVFVETVLCPQCAVIGTSSASGAQLLGDAVLALPTTPKKIIHHFPASHLEKKGSGEEEVRGSDEDEDEDGCLGMQLREELSEAVTSHADLLNKTRCGAQLLIMVTGVADNSSIASSSVGVALLPPHIDDSEETREEEISDRIIHRSDTAMPAPSKDHQAFQQCDHRSSSSDSEDGDRDEDSEGGPQPGSGFLTTIAAEF